MRIRQLHRWDVTPAEAREIQLTLRQRLVLDDRLPRIRRFAGADVAFDLKRKRAIAGVILYSVDVGAGLQAHLVIRSAAKGQGGSKDAFPRFELNEIERVWAEAPLKFPYVPGLLSFREAPALLAALAKLRHPPDVIFCDAQGYAHPRRFGLASHLGVLLDRPTIGCAKSRLIGVHGPVARAAGSWTPLTDLAQRGELIGAVLRTRDAVNPIYVSQGHRVSLPRAIALTLAVCDGFRIPRPTRDADHFVRELKSW
ncbi:MAG TPA: endonuclease V [Terriglobia bacterium]|jgi:deoxyribonuclease V